MSGTTDVVNGRIKEAAGALTNNHKLREKGKAEQVAGKVKQSDEAEKAAHEANDVAEKAQDTAKKAQDESKDDTTLECATDCE